MDGARRPCREGCEARAGGAQHTRGAGCARRGPGPGARRAACALCALPEPLRHKRGELPLPPFPIESSIIKDSFKL